MGAEAALMVCRWVHDAAAMALWGSVAYLAALVPRPLADEIARTLLPWGCAAAALAVASTAATLPIAAALVGDGWSDALSGAVIGSWLLGTAAGGAWLWQAAAAAALAAVLFLPSGLRRSGVALVSGTLVATLALTGHAVMHDGAAGVAQQLNDAAHVLSAGAWFGALVPLALVVRQLGAPRRRAEAMAALRRYSAVGHFAVAIALLTGIANTLFIVGAPPIDWSVPYQALLSAKIAVVATMIALALANRYAVMPRIGNDDAAAVVALRRGTLIEIGLGLAAIALVAVFGTLDPLPG
jgi:putative copper resistance protein D